MSSRRAHYLDVMGIQRWERRDPVSAVADEQAEVAVAAQQEVPAQTRDTENVAIALFDWRDLQARVATCTRCPDLVANRTQTVFGVGNHTADWLVIGEAPGAEEDIHGEPFVGRAGQLLNAMLLAIGLKREQVFIANILKCRPPNNRDPKPEEAANCAPYLQRQIALIQPKIILAVGRIAAQNLLNSDTPIGKLRSQVHSYRNILLLFTYHPAYLLRSPSYKLKACEYLKLARSLVAAS